MTAGSNPVVELASTTGLPRPDIENADGNVACLPDARFAG